MNINCIIDFLLFSGIIDTINILVTYDLVFLVSFICVMYEYFYITYSYICVYICFKFIFIWLIK